jgi:hypothetical protein
MSIRRYLNVIILVLVFTIVFNFSVPSTSFAKDYSKATWVWNTSIIVNASQDLLSYASSNGVNMIYLQISTDIETSEYQAFIKKASAQGIKVYALDGAPKMALEAEREQVTAFLNWIEAYQQQVEEDEKFAGVHVDIEPYLLPEWQSDWQSLVTEWQSTMKYISNRAQELHLHASADMPFWFDEYQIPGNQMTLSRWLIGQFDSITIMAYRDSAELIFSFSENELKEAKEQGKTIMLGVETNPSSEIESVTFYEEGSKYMNKQLLKVQGMANKYNSFEGIAIHDYIGWKSLKK